MSADRLPIGAVLGLVVTQIIGYGTLYDSFSILAPDMARDFGLSVEWMFGALSAALLTGIAVAGKVDRPVRRGSGHEGRAARIGQRLTLVGSMKDPRATRTEFAPAILRKSGFERPF